jgi:phosphoglycolate phosphatase
MLVLLDLDGTLSDSRPGIVRCLAHALRKLGRDVPPEEQLLQWIGPPLATAFRSLLNADDPVLIDEAIGAYRARYRETGIFETTLYPTTLGGLGRLGDAGHSLRVVTAKPEVFARTVLRHLGVDEVMDDVHGPTLDDRVYSKSDLIGAALASADVSGAEAVTVGDRAEDVVGARAHGCRAVRAMWGYGTAEEFRESPPDHEAQNLVEVTDWLLHLEAADKTPPDSLGT